MLRVMLAREFRLVLREPMVIAMILSPLVIYALAGSVLSGATVRVERAARLQGASVAIVPGGAPEEALAKLIVDRLRESGVNASIARGDPLSLLDRFNMVIVLPAGLAYNITSGRNATILVYSKGDPTHILASLVGPSMAGARAADILLPQRGPRLEVEAFVVLGGRVYRLEELQAIASTGMILSSLSILVIAPAASIASILMGSEREEKMLEALLALPVKRSTIAAAKIATSVAIALLTAASAAAGFYIMVSSVAGPAGLVVPRYYTGLTAALYIASLLVSAAFAATVTLILALFASTIRGAQATSIIVLLAALVPVFAPFTGLSLSPAAYATPFYCIVLSAYQPVLGAWPAATAILVQTLETVAAATVFAKLLDTELVVTGPEAVKRLTTRLSRGR